MPHWVKKSTVFYGCRMSLLLVLCLALIPALALTDNESVAKRRYLVNLITTKYSAQLGNPEVKKRKSMSQFGYNLYFTTFPLFPIRQFVKPHHLGQHSYGKHISGEKNGALYTCKGGFMDISHIRAAIDWTVFLTFKIIVENGDFELPAQEGGRMQLHFTNLEKLSTNEIASMAQKIAYERLLWHELASWQYHMPNYTFNEQQSAFTPEDIYSNFLGTVIGRNVALRILQGDDSTAFTTIASEEIDKMIDELRPVQGIKQTEKAYDIVDRHQQMKLPEDKRNTDVWWDSKIVFKDERYVFKRYTDIGPVLQPWLIPKAETVGCTASVGGKKLEVPQKTKSGESFYDYYVFTIMPDALLFYTKKGKQLHPPFGAFTSRQIDGVLAQKKTEMELQLLP